MQEENYVPTPYDDAFRTLLNDCADLNIFYHCHGKVSVGMSGAA